MWFRRRPVLPTVSGYETRETSKVRHHHLVAVPRLQSVGVAGAVHADLGGNGDYGR